MVQVWAFIESERAIIIVPETHFAKELIVGLNPLPMYIKLKNGGKSTATIDVLRALITHKLPLVPVYFGIPNFTIAPIVPNDTSERILNFETGWGQDTNEGVKSGHLQLFIYGVVEYRDEFSRRLSWFLGARKTGFCFIYKPTGGVREPIFETCKESAYTYTH